MAARQQVTNKLQGAYRRASKGDKDRVLDQVVAATGVGRSTVRTPLSAVDVPMAATVAVPMAATVAVPVALVNLLDVRVVALSGDWVYRSPAAAFSTLLKSTGVSLR